MAIKLRTDLLLQGKDIQLNDNITVINPTIDEILEYGEEEYWKAVTQITSTSYQYLLFFHKQGLNYQEISDYEMFVLLAQNMTKEQTQLILKDIDLSELTAVVDNEDGSIVLIDRNENIIIDEAIYYVMVEYIRTINNVTREYRIPGNEHTYNIYIREAEREEQILERKGAQPFESLLEPLISALCNHPSFKYDHMSVGQVSLYTLMDSLKRIQLYENYRNLISAIYAGTIDSKSIKKDELNWFKSL